MFYVMEWKHFYRRINCMILNLNLLKS